MPQVEDLACCGEFSFHRDVLCGMRARLSEDLAGSVFGFLAFRSRLASSRGGAGVTLWGPGGPARVLRRHAGEVTGIAFFPLGDRLLTWSEDTSAIVWDVDTGDVLVQVAHGSPVAHARIFPDGERVISCGEGVGGEGGACFVWRAATGRTLCSLDSVRMQTVEVFPSGDRVLSWGFQDWAAVWDATSCRTVCKLHGHTMPINVASIFPSGDKVITGSSDDRAIIWNASSCVALHELAHSDWVMSVAVLRGGAAVATGTGNGRMAMWSARSGMLLRTITESRPRVMDLLPEGIGCFPAGDRLATFMGAEAVIWNATTGEATHRLVSFPNWTRDLAVAPGGDVVAVCGSGRVTVWDAASGLRLHEFEEGANAEAGAFAQGPEDRCLVAVGLGAASDPRGFGLGLPWRQLSRAPAAAA